VTTKKGDKSFAELNNIDNLIFVVENIMKVTCVTKNNITLPVLEDKINKNNVFKCYDCSYVWYSNENNLLCKKHPHPFKKNCYRLCSDINKNGDCEDYIEKDLFEKIRDFIFE